MQIYVATGNAGKLRDFAQAAAVEGIEILPLPGLDSMPEPSEDAPDFTGNAALKAIAYSLRAPGLLVLADDSGLAVDTLNGRPGIRSARFADDLNFEPDSGLGKDSRNNRCLLALLHTTELEAPYLKTPNLNTPNLNTPNLNTPNLNTPNLNTPNLNTPNLNTPDPNTPYLNTPKLDTPPLTHLHRTARFLCAVALARNGEVLHHAGGTLEGEILDTPRGTNGFGYDPLFLIPAAGKTMAELDPATRWTLSHRGCAFRALLQILGALHPSGAGFRTT